jgi:hypothetical protein
MTSCAHQPAPGAQDVPGFLMGLVHGFICPGSLISSVFNDVRIYAFPNSGGLYDLGFTLGGFTVSCFIMMVLADLLQG